MAVNFYKVLPTFNAWSLYHAPQIEVAPQSFQTGLDAARFVESLHKKPLTSIFTRHLFGKEVRPERLLTGPVDQSTPAPKVFQHPLDAFMAKYNEALTTFDSIWFDTTNLNSLAYQINAEDNPEIKQKATEVFEKLKDFHQNCLALDKAYFSVEENLFTSRFEDEIYTFTNELMDALLGITTNQNEGKTYIDRHGTQTDDDYDFIEIVRQEKPNGWYNQTIAIANRVSEKINDLFMPGNLQSDLKTISRKLLSLQRKIDIFYDDSQSTETKYLFDYEDYQANDLLPYELKKLMIELDKLSKADTEFGWNAAPTYLALYQVIDKIIKWIHHNDPQLIFENSVKLLDKVNQVHHEHLGHHYDEKLLDKLPVDSHLGFRTYLGEKILITPHELKIEQEDGTWLSLKTKYRQNNPWEIKAARTAIFRQHGISTKKKMDSKFLEACQNHSQRAIRIILFLSQLDPTSNSAKEDLFLFAKQFNRYFSNADKTYHIWNSLSVEQRSLSQHIKFWHDIEHAVSSLKYQVKFLKEPNSFNTPFDDSIRTILRNCLEILSLTSLYTTAQSLKNGLDLMAGLDARYNFSTTKQPPELLDLIYPGLSQAIAENPVLTKTNFRLKSHQDQGLESTFTHSVDHDFNLNESEKVDLMIMIRELYYNANRVANSRDLNETFLFKVEQKPGGLVIIDNAGGFKSKEDRDERESGSAGLGRNIIKIICQTNDWDLQRTDLDGGTRFELKF